MVDYFTIGQLAQKCNVNIETIRFYERNGLLPPVPRNESGYRQFSPETVSQLQFIKNAKELGFSLKEIAVLLSLRFVPHTSCAEVFRIAEEKMKDIDKKINELKRMKKALKTFASACSTDGSVEECHFLELLNQS